MRNYYFKIKSFFKTIYIISTHFVFNSIYQHFKHFVNCNSVDFPLIKPYLLFFNKLLDFKYKINCLEIIRYNTLHITHVIEIGL